MLRRFLFIPLVLASLTGCGPAGATAAKPAPPASAGSATAGASTGTTMAGPAGGPTSPSKVEASTAALTGTQHAFLTSVDTAKGTISFDLVEWFEGAQAAAACKEDGETETANDRCSGYYFRNKSHQLRTLPVKPGATLRVLGEGANVVPADIAKVRAAVGARQSLWKLEVAGGEITKAEEIYLP